MLSILTYSIIILLFILFMYYYVVNGKTSMIEKFQNMNSSCPNVLIEKDGKFYLMNSNKQQIPGVNPIVFENLEEYVEFIEWQRHMGIRCPVLYLQKSNNAQGENEFKIRPNVLDKCGGLPSVQLTNNLLVDATRDDMPYNINSYPGFDASSYYVGKTTPLDEMNINDKELLISPDPMNDNWGGNLFTQKLIDKGYYKGNEVSINVP